MNMKMKLVLALAIALGFPAISLYALQNAPATVPEDVAAVNIATDFLKRAPTYAFDGVDGSLIVQDTLILESYPVQYDIIITFDSSHAGYGDRTDQVLAQVITGHTARVKVVSGEVVSAVIDDVWDEMGQQGIGSVDDNEPNTTVISPEFAVDSAVAFAIESHDELEGLEAPTGWEITDLTPEYLLGASKIRLTSGDWTVEASWAVVRFPVYNVEITLSGEGGFTWEGSVDNEGTVTEDSFSLS